MVSASPTRLASCALATIAAAACSTLLAPQARAIEAFDGRLQLHGFVEVQLRALSRNLDDEIDLAQWYNVLNLEFEADIAPDGWGPTDLIEAFVRIEARYDCVWTHGCGMLQSQRTYGNDAKDVPPRFRDARGNGYSGVIPATAPGIYAARNNVPRDANFLTVAPVPRIGTDRTANFVPDFQIRTVIQAGPTQGQPVAAFPDPDSGNPNVGEIPWRRVKNELGEDFYVHEPFPGEGIPGFSTLFAQRGADNVLGTADDPALYTFGPLVNVKTPYSWALADFLGPPGGSGTQLIGPWRPDNVIQPNGLLQDIANPFRGSYATTAQLPSAASGLSGGDLRDLSYRGSDPLDPFLQDLKAFLATSNTALIRNISGWAQPRTGDVTGDSFAGDYSGVLPCVNPTGLEAEQQRQGQVNQRNCVPNPALVAVPIPPVALRPRTYPGSNVKIGFDDGPFGGGRFELRTGGAGELPMRPAPDLSNLASNPGFLQAKGIYYPSRGLRNELASGDLDSIDFNFTEGERAWNRGQSQQQTGELKEAYLDIEWLESRLWTRIGKQSIVWGKTELFRTTDQFNPQDFALANLPSLEESRIALWAFRAVYSLYDVGPMEDVRLEVAANFDEFQPADLGAAGEPFTLDLVGGLTSGIFFHSVTGVGVAGIDRPDNPWDNINGLEVGGRIEWRWDRFSFALTDFYGYNDFPYIDRIWTYDRTVDPVTGRPLSGGFPGTGASACTSPVLDRDGDGAIDSYEQEVDPSGNTTTRRIIDSKSTASYTMLGIGAQSGCLKGGGAAGYGNYDPLFGGDQNALENHYANQTIFAWICNTTLGIGATLDAGSCAWNIFGSPAPLVAGVLDTPFGEALSTIVAGDPDQNNMRLLQLVNNALKPGGANGAFQALARFPFSTANLDRGPDMPLDPVFCTGAPGSFDPLNTECALWDGEITATVFQINDDPIAPLDITQYTHTAYLTGDNLALVKAIRGPNDTGNVDYLVLPDGTEAAKITSTCRANRVLDASNQVRGFRQWVDIFGDGINEFPQKFANILNFLGPLYDPSPSGICARNFFVHQPGDLATLDSTLTSFQKALLGCGPFFGTRCDSAVPIDELPTDEAGWATPDEYNAAIELIFPEGGGIDFLNTDASVLEQSWPGIEGTAPTNDELSNSVYWTTLGRRRQPGTAWVDDPLSPEEGGHEMDRVFGPRCTRPGVQGLLPGCRGIESIVLTRNLGVDPSDPSYGVVTQVGISFDDGYDPRVDGCLVGGGARRLNAQAIGHIGGGTPQTGVDVFLIENGNGNLPDAAEIEKCHQYSLHREGGYTTDSMEMPGSDWIWHPLAGCLTEAQAEQVSRYGNVVQDSGPTSSPSDDVTFSDCSAVLVNGVPVARSYDDRFKDLTGDGIVDIEQEFLNTIQTLACETVGSGPRICEEIQVAMAQMFQNELAAVSWNFLGFLVTTSCSAANEGDENVFAKPECFDPGQLFSADKCSFNAPHLCSNVKGFLSVAGVTAPIVLAGGDGNRGRRTFIWHSGGEIVLRYEKRNVLGFSMDFAEDVTKSNWGVEFTWIEGVPVFDSGSYTNITKTDSLNLTVSVDRPTFINFLNPNRTVFINTQWFFQYITDYSDSFPSHGPWNVLFTFAAFTGYFQDRLQPQFVSVFDVQSLSGGFLPQVQYRFTEAFSATLGVNIFFGRTELHRMSVNEIAPASNRAPQGNNEAVAYQDGVENVLSVVRKRDEFYLRLRWTF
jgi:hypothetical protein